MSLHLSDSWQKGAQQLSLQERTNLANDPRNLIPVDGPTNAKKSDSDAASWLRGPEQGVPMHLRLEADHGEVGRLRPALRGLWEENYQVYGVRKLWKAARRSGIDVGRDQVARLMRAEQIAGVRRGKKVRTTRATAGADRHPDLVGRDFTATEPNQLWVTDLTHVPTWAGMGYVCFITDAYSRMIVGWRVAANMRTQVVYRLWVTQAEKDAMSAVLSAC